MKIVENIEKKLIKLTQDLINKAYLKEGLTDEILDAQIRLNELRNEYDINETDDEFVQ